MPLVCTLHFLKAMGACVSAQPECRREGSLPRKARAPSNKGAAVQHVLASGQALQAGHALAGGWSPSADANLFPADLQLSQGNGSLRITSQGVHRVLCWACQLKTFSPLSEEEAITGLNSKFPGLKPHQACTEATTLSCGTL